MTRRSTIWLVVASVFAAGNVAGAGFALAQGELLHASIHALLVLPGAYLAWIITRRARDNRRAGESAIPAETGEIDARLTHIEQSVDAVALEVERIGEGQRFMTHQFTDKGTPRSAGERHAEPVEKTPPEPPQGRRE